MSAGGGGWLGRRRSGRRRLVRGALVPAALGLVLGAAAAFVGALLQPRRPTGYDPRGTG